MTFSGKYGVLLVFLFAFILRSIVVTTTNRLGPDSEHHLYYLDYMLSTNGRSPTKEEALSSPKAITKVRHDLHEAIFQPPGFYLAVYPFYKMSPKPDTVRWFNVLLGSFTSVAVYYLVLSLISQNRRLAIMAGLFLAVEPTHVYLSTVVNNDVAIGFVSVMFLIFLLKFMQDLTSKKENKNILLPILTGIWLRISVWIKYSALSLFGVYAGSIVWLFWSSKIKSKKINLISVIIPIIFASLFLVLLSLRNYALGFGALEFLSGHIKYQIISHPPDLFRYYLVDFPLATFGSYWGGASGASNHFILRMAKYMAVFVLTLCFIYGLFRSFFECRKNSGWIVLYISIILGLFAYMYWNYVGYIPAAYNANARFLLPSFGTHAVFIAYGGYRLNQKIYILSLIILLFSIFA